MAIESHQPGALKYLLSLQEYYSIDVILEDTNRDGTTLLSAAVQHANREVVDIITKFLLAEADIHTISSYLEKEDVRGRTVAHYLFSAPYLMFSLGNPRVCSSELSADEYLSEGREGAGTGGKQYWSARRAM